MIVAIDGPAGVGKSTIAKKISDRYGFFYLNSGNFYRAAAYLAAMDGNKKIPGKERILEITQNSDMEIRNGEFYLNGEPVENLLHTDYIDRISPGISAIPELRDLITSKIREAVKGMDVVSEGRDITSVVFPSAEVKIYLDASAEERGRRRFEQGTSELDLDVIIENIKKRDEVDKKKVKGALKIVNDAIYLDTSRLTLDQVYERIKVIIEKNSNFGRMN